MTLCGFVVYLKTSENECTICKKFATEVKLGGGGGGGRGG